MVAVTFISGLQTPINFSLISCSSATSSVNILCFTQVETGKWNVLKVVLSPLPCKTSSGDQNVIHWGLQSTLQFPPRLSCVWTTFKPFWCDLRFFRDSDTVDKANEVCPTLYMPTELQGEQNAEKRKLNRVTFWKWDTSQFGGSESIYIEWWKHQIWLTINNNRQ